ncbi:hypothetical protein F5Y17DRAFT_39815 [Xylariaceae sp. FL0594]|nr:hypothetical protein F5Y17DRAFT_39815 [Xylariaceae sp. FL0594]
MISTPLLCISLSLSFSFLPVFYCWHNLHRRRPVAAFCVVRSFLASLPSSLFLSHPVLGKPLIHLVSTPLFQLTPSDLFLGFTCPNN